MDPIEKDNENPVNGEPRVTEPSPSHASQDPIIPTPKNRLLIIGLVFLTLFVFGTAGFVTFQSYQPRKQSLLDEKLNSPTPTEEKIYCGGIADIPCPTAGYTCTLEGNYPDMATVCVRARKSKTISDCAVGGCSGELCYEKSDDPGDDLVSPCIYMEEYECLKKTRCERQSDGKCGWTQTPEYTACLKSY